MHIHEDFEGIPPYTALFGVVSYNDPLYCPLVLVVKAMDSRTALCDVNAPTLPPMEQVVSEKKRHERFTSPGRSI